MTTRPPRRTRFRQILNGDRCVHPGSVSDPLSARIAEEVGFECGIFAGSVGSLAVLGAPDLIVMTLPDTKQAAIYEEDIAPNLQEGDVLAEDRVVQEGELQLRRHRHQRGARKPVRANDAQPVGSPRLQTLGSPEVVCVRHCVQPPVRVAE